MNMPQINPAPMNPAPVHVRRATVADASAFARIMGHPEVLGNLMQTPYTSGALWQDRLAETLAPGKADLMLVAERPDPHGDPQVVATAGLHPAGAALRRRHVMVMGIAVLPEAQGQGVGTALLRALCDWADNWGQVLRIELSVFSDNHRAITLYQRCGFRHEGHHVGYALRNGRYADSLSMARLHAQPPAWAPPGVV